MLASNRIAMPASHTPPVQIATRKVTSLSTATIVPTTSEAQSESQCL